MTEEAFKPLLFLEILYAMYDLDFLKTFNGNMSPYDVDISQLANVTEKYVSQYEYIYI